MDPGLYLCGTPIGNLKDASFRLIDTLRSVDVIAAEDTRRTRKLLTHYDIAGPRVVAYNDVNERKQTSWLVDRIAKGSSVALVTDSGMPSISDPGYRLVVACIDADLPVGIVPGPTAAVAALVVSGLPTDRFVFEGFLPRGEGDRKRRLDEIAEDVRTLIFYEAPGRAAGTLRDLAVVLGDRRAAVVRELTKVFEDVTRDRLGALAAKSEEIKGEVVIVVEGAERVGDVEAAVADAESLMRTGESPSRAAATSARKHGVTKKQVYDRLINRSSL